MKHTFPMGKTGTAVFSVDNGGRLTLTATAAGQTYHLEFSDQLFLEHKFYLRNEDARAVDTLNDKTCYTVRDNVLLAEMSAEGVTVHNRFTVDTKGDNVYLDTWVTSEKRIYDCGISVGKTKVDLTGLTQISGGDIPAAFPLTTQPPRLAFKDYAALEGENRYLKITGGFIFQTEDVFDAHFRSIHQDDDLTYFGEDNPLRTVYTFGKDWPVDRPAAGKGGETASGSIRSGGLEIPYVKREDGVGFLVNGKAYPMVAMRLQKPDGTERSYPDTLSGWKSVTVTEQEAYTEFLLMGWEGLANVGLRLLAEKDAAQSRISWTVEVINRAPDRTVIWCTYPRLHYAPQGLCDLFVPGHSGAGTKEFNRCDGFETGTYPAGLSYAMPYFAAYPAGQSDGVGIYMGIHDPEGAHKDLHALSDSVGGQIRLNCKYGAPGMGVAANGFTLTGKAVWQQFAGDWFDATEIYRQFVEEECDWLPEADENGRGNIPQWMRDIPFWVMDWMPNEEAREEPIPVSIRPKGKFVPDDAWYRTPIRLREALGVPIGYHLYNWHKIPFNNDFPHFLPTKKALPEGLQPLKDAGIRVMPYINALLWDTRDHYGDDYQFTSIAKPGAVKMTNGEIRTLTYASHEPDGELVKLAPMCPSYPAWREKLKEIVTALFNDYGMDAVYLDQLAAHIPHFCMDTTHSHAPGGGGWWQKEYRALMGELNAVKPADKAFTSEGNGEVFANVLDGFLSWAWIVSENCVPAFMRIYGGKTPALGRNANGYMKENPVYWRYHLAQGLISGEQMGWINADFVDDARRLAFAKKLICYRYENRLFFRGARPMRPPVVEAAEDHKFACGIGMENPGVLHQPYLCVGALENGKKRRLIAVNVGPEEISDTVIFRPEELGLTAENCRKTGDGAVTFVNEGRLQLTLPGDSLLALDWEV